MLFTGHFFSLRAVYTSSDGIWLSCYIFSTLARAQERVNQKRVELFALFADQKRLTSASWFRNMRLVCETHCTSRLYATGAPIHTCRTVDPVPALYGVGRASQNTLSCRRQCTAAGEEMGQIANLHCTDDDLLSCRCSSHVSGFRLHLMHYVIT